MSEHDPGFDGPIDDDASSVDPSLPPDHSLSEDIRSLIDDGKTYFEAELQFQKSRAAFVADRGRSGAIYGVGALALIHLALVALVVGLVLALTPAIGAWAATGVVVAALLIVAVILGLMAKRRFTSLSSAFGGPGK